MLIIALFRYAPAPRYLPPPLLAERVAYWNAIVLLAGQWSVARAKGEWGFNKQEVSRCLA